jgi:hypothetical protein
MGKPFWDVAWDEPGAGLANLAVRARAEGIASLLFAVVGLTAVLTIAAGVGFEINSPGGFNDLAEALIILAIAVSVPFAAACPFLALGIAGTTLFETRRSALARESVADEPSLGAVRRTRRRAMLAIAITLLLPLTALGFIGGDAVANSIEGHRWDVAFAGQQSALQAAADAVTSAPDHGASHAGDDSATPLPPALTSAAVGGSVSFFADNDTVCIFFPQARTWRGDSGYGYAYCVGSETPDETGVTSVHRLAPHWWVVTDQAPSGD